VVFDVELIRIELWGLNSFHFLNLLRRSLLPDLYSLPSNDGAERDLFEVTIQSMTEKQIGKYLVSMNTYKNRQTNSTFCDFRGITKVK
jgi:hypothetical protein